jgi:hypothetical protein
MTFANSCAQATVAVAAFGLATLAHAELPDLQAKQVLRPIVSDFEVEPGDADFGRDVVVKGNLAIIGIPVARNGVGRAAVLVRDASGKWIRRATLEASDSVPVAEFGTAVSVSGRRAVIGSRNAVYVFESDSTGWHQRQKLFFGKPILVSDIDFEGNLVAIGTGGSFGGNSTNGVHVFLLGTDGVFRAITRTVPTDVQPTDQFGEAVALSGTTLAVTAPRQNNFQGAAYLFACTNTGCVRKQKLLANDGAPGDRFGDSVDVLNNTLVIGASGADAVFGDSDQEPSEQNFTAQGAAYVYVRSTSTRNEWTEQQKLRITPQEYNWYYNLGTSVALSANRLVVSAPYGMQQFEPGKMFVFALSGGMYTATHKVIGSLGLGTSVSVSGTQLLSGAPQEDLFRGEADVYALP